MTAIERRSEQRPVRHILPEFRVPCMVCDWWNVSNTELGLVQSHGVFALSVFSGSNKLRLSG